MQTSMLFLENVYMGIVLAFINGFPLQDRSVCGDGWTYGRFLSGRGCLRPLTASYTRRHCLMDGNHLTLVLREVTRSNIYCVKEEQPFDRDPPTSMPMSTTTTPLPLGDTKLSPDELISSKEDLAKAFGCCNASLE